MKKILFIGTHGQKNWGDELLLKVFVEELSTVVEKFYINSYLPDHTEKYLDDVNVSTFNTKTQKHKLLHYLYQCDAVVFGGGSIIKELYTAYGGKKYGTLRVIDTLTRAAKLYGKPVFFCNIGVGPVITPKGLALSKKILDRATYTSVRDPESFRYLEKINPTSLYESASDAVFSVDRAYLGLSSGKNKPKGNPTIIGINLCRNIQNNENWDHFIHNLATDMVRFYKEKPNIKFVGIPMQFDVVDNNDEKALTELRTLMHSIEPSIDMTIARPDSVASLSKIIESVDLVVAARLHAIILATVIGKPFIALEYDIKVTGVLEDLSLEEYGVDINKPFSESHIYELLSSAVSNLAKVTDDVFAAYESSHKKSVHSFNVVKEKIASEIK